MSALAWLLLVVPLWPGLLALAALRLRRHGLGSTFAIAGAIPALGVGLVPPLSQEVSYPWLLLGARLGTDEIGAVFLLFTAIIWMLAGLFAFHWIRRPGRERFFAFFLLTMSGNLGTLLAMDLVSFYAFFSLMSFAAYGLIVHELTREARHAANVYLVLVVIGEAALAAALTLAAGGTGSIDFEVVRTGLEALPTRHLVIALAFLGFGIKAGALILHVWLPLAHPVAPAPASGVLSGAIIVTGLVGWLRVLPIGVWALPGWGGACVVLGLAAAFYAAIVGMDQRDPKVLLAYSSVSQVGIMTLGIGMLLFEPALSPELGLAVALFAMHHGLAKCALFLGAGLAKTAMDATRRRWLVAGLALPSLALAGAPFTSGMVVKSALAAAEAALPGLWSAAIGLLLPLSAVTTALLMARFLMLVRAGIGTRSEAARGPWLTWCVSLLAVLLLPLWLSPGLAVDWGLHSLLHGAWPLGAALFIGAVAIHAWRRAGRPPVPEIPAGDVLLPMERLAYGIRDGASALAARLRSLRDGFLLLTVEGRRQAWGWIDDSAGVEAWLNSWPVALTLLILVGAALAWLAT